MRYRDIDRFIARFALSRGYTLETAKKRLLWKHLENERILTELLAIVRERLEKGVLDRALDGKKEASNEV
jgi:hypothetical protein